MRWVSPFPLTRRTQSRSLPAKSLLFENFSKIFFEAGLSSENRKKRPASRNGPAGRRNVLRRRLLTWYSSYSKPDCSDGGAMLFLTDVNHVSSGKANETRQINLPSATASLQVVIGLCKRKETAALKFKAAASYRRVDRTAVRRLFSFAVARQFDNKLFVFLRIIIQFKCYTNVRGNFAFDRKSG